MHVQAPIADGQGVVFGRGAVVRVLGSVIVGGVGMGVQGRRGKGVGIRDRAGLIVTAGRRGVDYLLDRLVVVGVGSDIVFAGLGSVGVVSRNRLVARGAISRVDRLAKGCCFRRPLGVDGGLIGPIEPGIAFLGMVAACEVDVRPSTRLRIVEPTVDAAAGAIANSPRTQTPTLLRADAFSRCGCRVPGRSTGPKSESLVSALSGLALMARPYRP